MKQRILLALIFFIHAVLTYGQYNPPLVTIRGETQGTTYQIKYLDDEKRVFKQEIESLLNDIDRCVSNYRPDSEIAAFNQSHSVRFQRPYFYDLLKKSKAIYLETEGAFDPTIYPLVEAYGFGPDRKKNIPENLDSLLSLIGFDKISFDSVAVAKAVENVRLDFNAIAKGYTTDKIADLLASKNIQHYLIEIGGEIRGGGEKSPGQPWKVGIENPFNLKSLSGTIELSNHGMATSGNYRNRYTKNGHTINHIINPKTGSYEASELYSATVLAPDAATADAYATAFMVMGLKNTINLLNRHPDLSAYLIYADDQGKTTTYISENIRNIVSLSPEN